MRVHFALLTGAAVFAASSAALAQEECPPGGWFCEEVEEGDLDTADEVEEGDVRPDPPRKLDVPSKKGSPPVVVYYPADKPPPTIVVERAKDRPKPPKRRRKREWGFNLRLQGVMMGSDRADLGQHPDAGMGGVGFSFRYRPVPAFAFDVGLDVLGGTDWNGNERGETALSFNGLVFFNPKDKLQLYMLGGLGFSGANVNITEHREFDVGNGTTTSELVERDDYYSYFGGQLGIGLEWRVGKKTALNLDVVGFVRGRTDEDARFEPEFVHPRTGRTTNTSGGGLFRGGITFYW